MFILSYYLSNAKDLKQNIYDEQFKKRPL